MTASLVNEMLNEESPREAMLLLNAFSYDPK